MMNDDYKKYLFQFNCENDDQVEIDEAIRVLCGGQINESSIFAQLNDFRKQMQDPRDLDAFMKSHWHEIEDFEKNGNLTQQQKSIFSRAWECIKHAASKGFEFVKKHWKKILLVLLLIAAMLWFGMTEQGVAFGTKLFGKGYETGVEVAKEAVKKALTLTDLMKDPTKVLTLDALRKVSHWIDVTELMGDKSISIGLDGSSDVFWSTLPDGRSCYQFGGNDRWYVPAM